MANVLVLWDLDLTLLNAGGAGAQVYREVFRELFARDLPEVPAMAGRTERAIILDALTLAGVDQPASHVDAFITALSARAAELQAVFTARGHVLPGALDALAAVAAHAGSAAGRAADGRPGRPGPRRGGPQADRELAAGRRADARVTDATASTLAKGAVEVAGTAAEIAEAVDVVADAAQASGTRVVQSVLTGNVRAIAEAKLAAFGLAGHLDLSVGAYGEHHAERAELVHLARRQAALAYGLDFSAEATVLIGDTPLDVAAALATGARVVGVATGGSTIADLREAGAQVVLPDLADTAAVLAAVLGEAV